MVVAYESHSTISQPSGVIALRVALSISFACLAVIGRWELPSVCEPSVGINTSAVVSH